MTSVKNVLIKTKKLLAPRNAWIKGSMHETRNGKDQYCLYSALYYAANKDNDLADYARDYVYRAIRARIHRKPESIIDYNDSNRVTKSSITAVLNSAIKMVA